MRDRVKVEPLRGLAGGALAGVSVVLVETRNPINIGAVARVMANFGLERLVLVKPRAFPHPEATRMAAGGIELVRRARVAKSLEEALQGHARAFAFTRREGKLRRPFLTPRDAGARILAAAAANSGGSRVKPVGNGASSVSVGAALVFGREDHGLSNADLRLCPEVVVIPSSPECASLNLAQAVTVAAYESFLAAAAPLMLEPLAAAPLADVRELLAHWGRAMQAIGFLDPRHPQRMTRYIERLFVRADLTPRDVRVLRGLARQMEWAAERAASRGSSQRACGILAAPSKEPRQRSDGRRIHSRTQPPPQPRS